MSPTHIHILLFGQKRLYIIKLEVCYTRVYIMYYCLALKPFRTFKKGRVRIRRAHRISPLEPYKNPLKYYARNTRFITFFLHRQSEKRSISAITHSHLLVFLNFFSPKKKYRARVNMLLKQTLFPRKQTIVEHIVSGDCSVKTGPM